MEFYREDQMRFIRNMEEQFGEVAIEERDHDVHAHDHHEEFETKSDTDDVFESDKINYDFMNARTARKITERIQNDLHAIMDEIKRKIIHATSKGRDNVIVYCGSFYHEINEYFSNHHLGYIVSPHHDPSSPPKFDTEEIDIDVDDVCFAMISW